ncbi:MAG: CotH kinase family protein [candidate division KSB1 bacterium]|nr:CotH kinase family protein [candidate division KSB1 bacterium]
MRRHANLTIFLIPLLLFHDRAQGQTNEYPVALHFSHTRGIYRDNFTLTIVADVPTALIRYCFDGTNPINSPSAQSAASPAEIAIDPADTLLHDLAPGVCVRAVALQNGKPVSRIETHTFLFVHRIVELSPDGRRPGPGWPPQRFSGDQQFIHYGLDPDVYNHRLYRDQIVPAFLDIPSISMVMDLRDLFDAKRGIYVNAGNHGPDWERPCSLELILPNGEPGFQIDAGVRIRGGYSRSNQNPKHAFRFFFRREYGQGKLKYPLFGDEGVDEFDAVDLRTSQNYSWAFDGSDQNTLLRDVFSRDCQRDMGHPYTRSRYYHLYINGTYWGLYQTQERSEASFAAGYLGGAPEDYDVIKVAADQGYIIEATDGTLDAWRTLWEIARNGFRSDSAYYLIQGKNPDGTPNQALPVLLDIDNLIDYMLITFYTGNLDAPVSNFLNNTSPNNFFAVRSRVDRRGFVFFQHDAEHTLLNVNENRTGPYPAGSSFDKSNPHYLHQRLMEHPAYRARFADRVALHFTGDGALTPHRCAERLLQRKAQIDKAIIAESARWGDSKRNVPFTKDNAWLPAVNRILNEFFPNRTAVVLNQFKTKGWINDLSAPRLNAKSGIVPKGFTVQISSPGEIYYTTDGSDPYQIGLLHGELRTLFNENAEKYVLVPEQKMDFNWRRPVTMDFSSWLHGRGGVGYERDTGYEPYIHIDVGSRMYNRQTSCYIRIPFRVNKAELQDFNILQLKVMYDDGFAAYLNGWRCADALAPETITWDAQAAGLHESTGWEMFDISNSLNRLTDGDNFLAVHALNASANSSDFLFSAELLIGRAVSREALSPTAVRYERPLVIEHTTHLKVRAYSGQWSPLTETVFAVLKGLENLKVTEIHYHPLPSRAEANDDDLYEFIELKNIGEEELNLSGCGFARGIVYRFQEGFRLPGKSFVVLAADSAAFFSRYGFYPHGVFVGRLDNGGETLVFTAGEDTLFTVRYDDRWPWPRSADGGGYSLTSRDLEPWQDSNDGRNWIASSVLHGTPNRDDFIAASVEAQEMAVREYRLYQNYPNPFNAQTTIPFDLPCPSRVKLQVYNLRGQLISSLLDEFLDTGRHSILWRGDSFSSGVYFYRLQADDYIEIRKFTLVR